jgi:deoxyribonuclease-4
MNDYLGAHMSIAGGLHLAIDRAVAAGCGVVQIFTRNSNQWKWKAVSEADAALFREKFAASGLHEVVSHDIYLINLAAPPGEGRDKSLAAFRDELETCARLGIAKVVMHPGSHLADEPATGLGRVSEAFDQLFGEVPQFEGKVLLETTAGQGTNLGRTFEELQTIIDGSKFREKFGVCFDTCHTFAAGYDTATEAGYADTMEQFDRIIGLRQLQCFHFNDSKKGLGSRVDRHDHIGQGALGLNPFRFILNDPRFATIPKILETPKGDNDEMDAVNLGVLRGLVKAP